MKRFIPSVFLLLACRGLVAAQTSPAMPLDGLFDGRGRVELESFLPAMKEKAQAPAPKVVLQAYLPVLAEVSVASGQDPRKALDGRLAELEKRHGFSPDRDFAPRPAKEFRIMPYPPVTPKGGHSFVVRGWLAEDKVDAFRKDPAVLGMWLDAPAKPKDGFTSEWLWAYAQRYWTSVLAVPGVQGLSVGVDCPIEEDHNHVLPHKPALVIVLDGKLPEPLVRESLLKSVPGLSEVPFRFASAPEQAPRENKKSRVTPAVSRR